MGGSELDMADRKKTVEGLNATLRHCHNLYNKYSEDQQALAEINQAAKDTIELVNDLENEIRFLQEYRNVVDALIDVGYPHNFQREEPWIRDYCYKITRIVKMAYDVMEGKK